jgi:uncharacterized protein
MPFQILSLSGGGYLGLYTISVIAELEEQINRPIATCFDLLAGTSIGGILALALAAEHPARSIKKAFEENGSRIFSSRSVPKTRFGEWREFSRSLFASKYQSTALRQTVAAIIGENTLVGHLLHPVIVPTVNLTKGAPQVFKTDHHPNFKLDYLLKAVDVALATSAAPTYFPIASIGDQLFVDGGLYANSPDLMALHEAEHFFKVKTNEVNVLSIGTTTSSFSFSHSGRRDLGVLGWGQRLAQTILSSQQLDVEYILRHKLEGRYFRIDATQSKEQERDLGLDVANENAQKTIRGMAHASIQNCINDAFLQTLLSQTAPAPKFYHRGPQSKP